MLKLGRIFDIDVSLHWTLLLLIGWTAITAPLGSGLASAVFIAAMFGCVLLHEFGHSLAARQFGIETAGIVLYPIGGVATLERMPRDPKQELWVAIAGPLVNVVIAAGLFFLQAPAGVLGAEFQLWLRYLMLANMGLVLFNMLPAFPMDGGRVFRALAAMFLPYVQATNLAASIGRIVAIGLGLIGFWQGHLMLMLIAAFVFFVGSAEARAVASEFATKPTRRSANNANNHLVRAIRNGKSVLVVWDDALQSYRYASH